MLVGRSEELSRIESLLDEARCETFREPRSSLASPGSGRPRCSRRRRSAPAVWVSPCLQRSRHRVGGRARVLESAGAFAADPGARRSAPRARRPDALRSALALGPSEQGDRFAVYAATLGLLASASEETAGSRCCSTTPTGSMPHRAKLFAFAARRLGQEERGDAVGRSRTDDSVAFSLEGLERHDVGGLDRQASGDLIEQCSSEARSRRARSTRLLEATSRQPARSARDAAALEREPARRRRGDRPAAPGRPRQSRALRTASGAAARRALRQALLIGAVEL